jgi:signal transduction histidine kinase
VIALLPTAEGIWTAEAPSHIRLVSENGQMLKSFDLSRFGGTVYMLAQDGRGNIWFCQDGLEGLGRITPQGTAEAVLANRGAPAGISVIKRLPDGELYFGGGGKSGYFFRYNPRMEVFENLSHAAPFEHHLDIAVFDFIPDGGGGFWLASSFGLLRWKSQGLERLPLGELTQDVVKALAKDDAGGLWLANSNGLMRVDLGTGERYVFDEKDGLPSKIVGYRNLRADGAGRLWVATISGLSVGVAQAPQPTPTPVFTGFSVNNEAAGAGRAAALLADDFMMARFVSPVHPSRFVRYEARIAGAADSAWVPLKQANAFTVGHLPNGQYVLEIRAKQRANFSWSQPVRFPFEVSTPWHRSWWGMGLAFMAALAVVRMAMFWNVRRLKWEKDKLEAVVESRTRELVEKHAEIEAQREELLQNQEELQTTLENLRLAQSQLVQAEKMSSIGQLTAGIAHEINNPINFVYAGSNTLEQLLRDMHQVLLAYERVERTADEPEAHAKALEKLAEVKDEMGYEELRDDILALLRDIRMGADRATEIVRNLRNFSRTDEGHFEQADVEMGIDSTLTLLSNKLKQGVKVEKKYCGLPLLRCMPAQLNQVFMNILSNAIDAIDPPGTITISTQDFANEVRVVISDTGKGMDAEVQRHIFEPFFTTKPIGEGTGLGMSVAYSIVEKHEGRIEIDSEVGKGTSFILSLPKNLGRSAG